MSLSVLHWGVPGIQALSVPETEFPPTVCCVSQKNPGELFVNQIDFKSNQTIHYDEMMINVGLEELHI